MRLFFCAALTGLALTATPAAAQRYPAEGYLHDNPHALVRTWYQRFLNREPDAGAGIWINMLQRGAAPQAVLARLLGTDEYYEVAHATPDSFIATLYQQLVYGGPTPPGSSPIPPDFGYWRRLLDHESREEVAYKMLTRYPQSWPPRDDERYEYRRPSWRYRER